MVYTMVRTQIQLTEHQLKSLRQLSAATRRSVADLVRQGIKLYLASEQRASREQLIERALRATGRFSSGSADGSRDHDRHLAEALRG